MNHLADATTTIRFGRRLGIVTSLRVNAAGEESIRREKSTQEAKDLRGDPDRAAILDQEGLVTRISPDGV
jgi:hypothetical protein